MKRPWVVGLTLVWLPVVAYLAWHFLGSNPQQTGHNNHKPEAPWFVDVTQQLGLDFVHDPGPTDHFFMPQIMGSGCAFLDYDQDGRLDIYLVHMGGPKSKSTNRLFRQLPDGRFQDVSAGSGLDFADYCTGLAVGDINNDGWPDVLVTTFSGVHLLQNLGKGTFRDITTQAGVRNPSWGASAAFVDYNRDGWLDLVVVNYLEYDPSRPCLAPTGVQDYCHPKDFPGTMTRLFQNRSGDTSGKEIRFADVTLSSGLFRERGPGLGVLCADFDGDGWPDIFIANDGKPNRLWLNKQNGTFNEESVLRGLAYTGMGQAFAGMGAAWGDVDGDGLFDVFVTHLAGETHTLWQQGPRGLFQDRSALARLTRPHWQGTGFGTALADFDHDGDLDLAIVNGHVSRRPSNLYPELGSHWGLYADLNQLFVNEGGGKFRDISLQQPGFCRLPNVARGMAWGDVDGDGALDVLIASVGGPARLYRNVAPKQGSWLKVQAVLPGPRPALGRNWSREAYGAEITVRAGSQRWGRLLNPADSYLSSSAPYVHFGLGDTKQYDAIEVHWPDGSREAFPGGVADSQVLLEQGKGQVLK